MTDKKSEKPRKGPRKATAERGGAGTARPRKATLGSSGHASASERIDASIAALGDWRGERLAEIRGLIHEVDPEVVEDWKWMGTPVWSHGGMYALANAHKDKVKLTFFHGARLPDPKGLFNAGLEGNARRAIDLYEGDRIDGRGLAALLRAAVAYSVEHSVPKSKGSRKEPAAAKKAAKASAQRAGRKTARKAGKETARASAERAGAKGAEPQKAAPKPRAGKHKKPRLLAGGNPQIPKGDGDLPVQAYIAAIPGWKRDVGRLLDALITRTVPDVRKAVKWNSPFYGLEGQGWFLSYHCFARYVRVTFFRGTSLRPVPPGESKHEEVRTLDVHEEDRLDEARFVSWVRQAGKLPGERL